MTPVDDNALATYHKILSLDANNKQVLIGINSISKTYETSRILLPYTMSNDRKYNSSSGSNAVYHC